MHWNVQSTRSSERFEDFFPFPPQAFLLGSIRGGSSIRHAYPRRAWSKKSKKCTLVRSNEVLVRARVFYESLRSSLLFDLVKPVSRTELHQRETEKEKERLLSVKVFSRANTNG